MCRDHGGAAADARRTDGDINAGPARDRRDGEAGAKSRPCVEQDNGRTNSQKCPLSRRNSWHATGSTCQECAAGAFGLGASRAPAPARPRCSCCRRAGRRSSGVRRLRRSRRATSSSRAVAVGWPAGSRRGLRFVRRPSSLRELLAPARALVDLPRPRAMARTRARGALGAEVLRDVGQVEHQAEVVAVDHPLEAAKPFAEVGERGGPDPDARSDPLLDGIEKRVRNPPARRPVAALHPQRARELISASGRRPRGAPAHRARRRGRFARAVAAGHRDSDSCRSGAAPSVRSP